MPTKQFANSVFVIIIFIVSLQVVPSISNNQQLNPTKIPKNKEMAPMCGGVSEAKEPDETVLAIVESIRPELESKLGTSLPAGSIKPVSFKSQLVNGVNYFIKIDLGNDKFIHVRAYRSFAGETSLRAVQHDKRLLDEIEYFDIEN